AQGELPSASRAAYDGVLDAQAAQQIAHSLHGTGRIDTGFRNTEPIGVVDGRFQAEGGAGERQRRGEAAHRLSRRGARIGGSGLIEFSLEVSHGDGLNCFRDVQMLYREHVLDKLIQVVTDRPESSWTDAPSSGETNVETAKLFDVRPRPHR